MITCLIAALLLKLKLFRRTTPTVNCFKSLHKAGGNSTNAPIAGWLFFELLFQLLQLVKHSVGSG